MNHARFRRVPPFESPPYSRSIYDPATRLNAFLNPATRIARQRTLPDPPATAPPGNWAQQAGLHRLSPGIRDEDLGTRSIAGFEVHGYRRSRLLPGTVSGTGRPLVVREEYWYSEDLRINLLTRRCDPRSGELTITVKRIDRSEPSYDLFEIPAEYKLLDVTSPEAPSGDLQ